MKRLLSLEGIDTHTPRETLQKAYAAGWLLRNRNETSHVYNEDKAKEIYDHIKNNYPELQNVFNFLNKRFETTNE